MITRRDLLKTFCALPFIACLPRLGNAQNIVDFPQLKTGYAKRLKKILAADGLPYIDIESSCNSTKLDIDSMLQQYPKAKVIWCHIAQIRYIERASRYTPAYVDALIKRFPNLYFDTAFGDAGSIYPLSNQRYARIWAAFGGLKSE